MNNDVIDILNKENEEKTLSIRYKGEFVDIDLIDENVRSKFKRTSEYIVGTIGNIIVYKVLFHGEVMYAVMKQLIKFTNNIKTNAREYILEIVNAGKDIGAHSDLRLNKILENNPNTPINTRYVSTYLIEPIPEYVIGKIGNSYVYEFKLEDKIIRGRMDELIKYFNSTKRHLGSRYFDKSDIITVMI